MSQINLGNTQISSAKLGNNSVSEIYFGTTKVYPTGEVLPYKYWLGGYYTSSYTTVKFSDNFGPITKTITVNNSTAHNTTMSQNADHLYACGDYIRYSTDYGTTWTQVHVADAWVSIRTSENGQYVIASIGYGTERTNAVSVSSDYGVTWTKKYSNGEMHNVDVSRNGQYMVAVPNGRNTNYIRYSNDYGVNWSNSNLGNIGNNTNNIKISGNGQYVWFFRMGTTVVYRSTDYGATFTAKTQSVAMRYLAVSDTGQYVYLCPNDTTNNILKSSDYGVTFTSAGRTAPGSPSGITCSYDGKYVYTYTAANSNVYISADYGATWTTYTFGPYYAYSTVSRM